MLQLTKFKGAVAAIISKRSGTIMDNYIDSFKDRFLNSLRLWKTEVRMLLSVPYTPNEPNTSLYPKLREGDLRRSLSYRSMYIKRKRNGSTAMLRATINWDTRPKSSVPRDYGEDLNSSNKFKTKPFFGWKDRTYALLEKRIKQGLKGV